MASLSSYHLLMIATCIAAANAIGHFYCDFDRDLCNWQQSHEDQFDWTLMKPSDMNVTTTLSSDHTGSGSFIALDTSKLHNRSDEAILDSPAVTGHQCVSLWYLMSDSNMTTLKVSTGPFMRTLAWIRQGSQGETWNHAFINVNETGSYHIHLQGVAVTGDIGILAVDDVTVTEGVCPQNNLGIPGLSCDFEQDFCGYSMSSSPEWTRFSGSTSSSGTGPHEDHTTGTRFGHYVYVEASVPSRPGDKFRLESEPVNSTGTEHCLEFWYHMFGQSMGSLSVYLDFMGSSQHQLLWSRNGSQSDSWLKADVNIGATSRDYRIAFEAVKGNSYQSDIALDDIILMYGGCPTSTFTNTTIVISTSEPMTTQAIATGNSHSVTTNVPMTSVDKATTTDKTELVTTSVGMPPITTGQAATPHKTSVTTSRKDILQWMYQSGTANKMFRSEGDNDSPFPLNCL